jgi:NitT/TauT family transport system substrate-binding protein
MPFPVWGAIVQDGAATVRIEARMRPIPTVLILLLGGALFGSVGAHADDAISFGLDWLAEAEYGGYYQALATGRYAEHGLTVTIRQGGPQVNQMQLMMAGRLDFNLGGGRAI